MFVIIEKASQNSPRERKTELKISFCQDVYLAESPEGDFPQAKEREAIASLSFYTSLYMPAASSLRTLSATSRTSTATVRVPMEISILSPTFSS